MKTLRISHPAFFGTKLDETIRFYTELLGMEIVLRQPNLDDASMEHLFFHVGGDTFIAYFLPKSEQAGARYAAARPGTGGMNHLAIDVDQAGFAEAVEVQPDRIRVEPEAVSEVLGRHGRGGAGELLVHCVPSLVAQRLEHRELVHNLTVAAFGHIFKIEAVFIQRCSERRHLCSIPPIPTIPARPSTSRSRDRRRRRMTSATSSTA